MTSFGNNAPRRYFVDAGGRRVLIGLTLEETFEFERLDSQPALDQADRPGRCAARASCGRLTANSAGWNCMPSTKAPGRHGWRKTAASSPQASVFINHPGPIFWSGASNRKMHACFSCSCGPAPTTS